MATLLLVDDEADLRQTLSELLSEEGYQVATAAHGAAALEYLRAHPAPDLILLDVLMPVMNGLRFLEERRKEPRLARIPVLLLTACDDQPEPGSAAEGLPLLAKPFRPSRLIELVAACCRPGSE